MKLIHNKTIPPAAIVIPQPKIVDWVPAGTVAVGLTVGNAVATGKGVGDGVGLREGKGVVVGVTVAVGVTVMVGVTVAVARVGVGVAVPAPEPTVPPGFGSEGISIVGNGVNKKGLI